MDSLENAAVRYHHGCLAQGFSEMMRPQYTVPGRKAKKPGAPHHGLKERVMGKVQVLPRDQYTVQIEHNARGHSSYNKHGRRAGAVIA